MKHCCCCFSCYPAFNKCDYPAESFHNNYRTFSHSSETFFLFLGHFFIHFSQKGLIFAHFLSTNWQHFETFISTMHITNAKLPILHNNTAQHRLCELFQQLSFFPAIQHLTNATIQQKILTKLLL